MSQRKKLQQMLIRHGLRPSKRLGQHFLLDSGVLQRIVTALKPDQTSCVVEIGAGIANLTEALAATGARVEAVELDQKFRPLHAELLSTLPSSRIAFHYTDALDFDYVAMSADAASRGESFLVTGNIPYQITSALIMHILETGTQFDQMVMMMQREVAERLRADPGSKKNGSITIKVQYFAEMRSICRVPASSFYPPPQVESEILSFRRLPARLSETDRVAFFRLVTAAFGQRRKRLSNAVAAVGLNSKEKVESALESLGLAADSRAEMLDVAQFLQLWEALRSVGR